MSLHKKNGRMRIGFATIYAWRPHVEHTWYLAQLAQKAGHETKFLTCDADLPTCYSQLLHDRGQLRECFQCRIGGIRSYTKEGVASIGQFTAQETNQPNSAQTHLWAQSSASTLGRFESSQDYKGDAFTELVTRLEPSVAKVYTTARAWMIRERLDAVCLFNGRIDVTRAIFEAARSLGLPVVTHERTWFGNGIQLFPAEHCLGLQSVWKVVTDWKDKPLIKQQALNAASLVAKRFLRTNLTEWRAYNLNAIDKPWPVKNERRRFLILPSSMNEIWGHSDWESNWKNPLDALDSVINYLGITPADIVLRCHPNWSEKIGRQDGSLPENFYSNWAKKRGIYCIAAESPVSTMHLIEQCDAVIVASGSAALEAGMLGKTVITTSPSIYHLANFTINVHGPNELENLKLFKTLVDQSDNSLPLSDEVARYALRFAYAMVWRLPQFVTNVVAKKTTEFEYFVGADIERFMRMFTHQVLEVDDATYERTGTNGEDDVLALLREHRWKDLVNSAIQADEIRERTVIKRRAIYAWVEPLRRMLKIGDR